MPQRVGDGMGSVELLTVADVAERLGVSKQTVYNWVYAFHLPHRRLGPSGRTIRFTEEDLEEYLAEQAR